LINRGELICVFVVERGGLAKQFDSFVPVLALGGVRAFSRKLVRFFVALRLGDLWDTKRQSHNQSKSRIFFLHGFQLDVNLI
jgi:hypothetical protein